MTDCSRPRSSSTCRSIIHPHLAPEPVRQAYYSELPDGAARVLETAGWGWHSETAIHVLRLVIAGTLDRHPKLKLIVGHMGEMLPMMMARLDEVFVHDVAHLKRPVSQTIRDQVWLTTSGIFDAAAVYHRTADLRHRPHHVLGRLSVRARTPTAAPSSTIVAPAPADKAKLCHAIADALLKLKTGKA